MPPRSPNGPVDYRASYRWAVVVLTLMFLTLLLRFFLLQIIRQQEYQHDQQRSRTRTERIPARRGLILDRNGVVLARNVETHDLVMVPSKIKDARAAEELIRTLLWLTADEEEKLRELIRVGMENRDRYDSIVIRQDLISDYCPYDVVRLETLTPKKKGLWSSQSGHTYFPATGGEVRCPHDESMKLKWNDAHTYGQCPDGVGYVTGTSDPIDGAPLAERTWSLQCPADGQLYNNERAIIEADLYRMPGIEVRTSLRRIYPVKNITAHLVGYVGQVTDRDMTTFPGRYGPGDRIGRTGVERSLEQQLRGQWGERHTVIERLSKNGPTVERPDTDNPDIPVQDGGNIRLTIDVELQRTAERAMRYHKSGAVVVVEVKSGEILALYSKPTFDPNVWSGRISADVFQETTASPYSPMLNKALTSYAPGSVYKLVTAVAALHSHLTDSKREVFCPGYFEYGGRRFRCHQHSGHGAMDMVHALARSCDVYFYKLGEELGMDGLYDYATRWFQMGMNTGIEIGESVGIVPTKAWHEKRDGHFMPGFTISTAVGQKDIKLTPLQVARAYAAVANGGRLPDMHVIQEIDRDDGTAIKVTKPSGVIQLPVTDDQMALLKEGFWRTVNDEHGTAFDARLEGLEVAGKTGTAEAAEKKAGVSEDVATWLSEDHAWFAGYAPARDPQIAVVVFVEHGHSGGKMAGPVAMQVIAGYFAKRPTGVPGIGASDNPIQSEPMGPPVLMDHPPASAARNDDEPRAPSAGEPRANIQDDPE